MHLAQSFHHEAKNAAKPFVQPARSNRLQTNRREASLMTESSELGFELPGLLWEKS